MTLVHRFGAALKVNRHCPLWRHRWVVQRGSGGPTLAPDTFLTEAASPRVKQQTHRRVLRLIEKRWLTGFKR
ncbi:MAG: hypothetical protein LUO80_02100 [Methylococcaceae bacterium]|nr:hypothetical protein [Methylococcaceae bacterium]